ncbi:MAG: hypothetical protein PHI79_07340 [Sulfurovaceae bacterium]|nr:hypothetical protein [Sulfurovaceae bacterium]MDD5549387.1 hypothetical protein [Sulfurovaceae bacterium]
MNEVEKLKFLRELFDEAVEVTKYSRKETLEAYEYERGNQLPEDVKTILENRGQPARWENLYKKIGNKISGMKAMSKQEITAFPRRMDDRDRADIISKVLRSFQDSTEWWTHKDRADKDLRLAGLSIIEAKLSILSEKDIMGRPIKEIEYNQLPATECFIDLYANAPDLSDARYFHHSKLYYKPLLKLKFGDKPANLTSNKYNMTRVTRTWYRDESNKIRCAIWADNVLLEDKPTPFTNLNRFPIAIRKLNFSTKKEYYGMFRDVRPFQDSINNTMLRIINMLGSSKLIVESDAVDDIDIFTSEYTQDNSVTEVRAGATGKIKDISQNAPIAQLMNIVQDARAQAEQVIGLNSELLGSAINRLSGYAIENRQNAGLVGLQNYMDVSGALDVDIAEISIKIMEEHFSAEQILMISDKDNKKIPLAINEYERNKNGTIKEKDGKPVQKSLIATGRYDLVLQRVPFNRGASGERQKNWTEIIKTLQVTHPQYIPPLLPVMLRDVDSPEAEATQKIIEEIQKQEALNAKKQQQDPAEQKFMLELEKMRAQIAELMTQAQLNTAKATKAAEGNIQG